MLRLNDNSNAKDVYLNHLKIVDKYEDEIWLFWKLNEIYKFREGINIETQRKVNNFIESGILIKESN